MKKKTKGFLLLQTVLAGTTYMLLAAAFFMLFSGQFSMIQGGRTALHAQQYAEIAANTLRLTPYDELADQGRQAIDDIIDVDGWEDEIILSPEKEIGYDNKQRIATVNIYKTGDVLARYSLQLPLSSQGTGIRKGMILAWSGSIDRVPLGWHLCDGSNGTPDLRDRFIVGAGSNYSMGATGGENYHTLSISEIPSHNHRQGSESIHNYGGGGNYVGDRLYLDQVPEGITGYTVWPHYNAQMTTLTGDNQPHENRPPYFSLAFIQRI